MTDHSDLIERLARESDPQTIAKLICEALSSQSLSLSEAREEIERLKGLVAGIRECPQETSGVEREAAYRSAWEASRLSDLGWEMANQNATPLSELAELIASCKAAVDAALENGPAGLADATPNPPLSDLSSLRKGAEVVVKPLVWKEYETEGEVDRWDAETALGSFYEISTEFDGYSVSNDHVHTDQRFDTPDEAKAFAQSDYEHRIRSALVSGSREEQS